MQAIDTKMRRVSRVGDPPAKVAIIIPYFQREPGLLKAAVLSILRQRDAPPVQMIVVDDGSPLPAEHDLDAFGPEVRDRILVVRQPNRGAAAARNAGLERVPPVAEWIAFLDPDDIWGEDHLCTAIAALEKGYDLFFADNRRVGEDRSLFEELGLSVPHHRPIDKVRALHEFTADLFTTVLSYSPIITSTVVYRRDGYAHLRFRESYRTYEDSLFWLHFRDARVAFCANNQALLGLGVNISKRPDEWRSNRALEILRDIDGMYRLIPATFGLTPQQLALVRRLRRRNRRGTARTVVAMARRRVEIDRAVVKEVLGGTLAILGNCLRVAATELAGRAVARPWQHVLGGVLRHRTDQA